MIRWLLRARGWHYTEVWPTSITQVGVSNKVMQVTSQCPQTVELWYRRRA